MSRFQFAVFLLVILIAEIAIGIVAFVNRGGWETEINGGLTDLFSQYGNDTATNTINDLQKTVSYCNTQNKFGPNVSIEITSV
jgi:hypothetical protein